MIYIKEIFSSIQGESNYVGYKQLFIRFCKCNLNCKFCDTDFSSDLNSKLLYTPEKLITEIDNMQDDLKTIHSISFTGGEPLLFYDFINNFINLFNNKYSLLFLSNSFLVLFRYLSNNSLQLSS